MCAHVAYSFANFLFGASAAPRDIPVEQVGKFARWRRCVVMARYGAWSINVQKKALLTLGYDESSQKKLLRLNAAMLLVFSNGFPHSAGFSGEERMSVCEN